MLQPSVERGLEDKQEEQLTGRHSEFDQLRIHTHLVLILRTIRSIQESLCLFLDRGESNAPPYVQFSSYSSVVSDIFAHSPRGLFVVVR